MSSRNLMSMSNDLSRSNPSGVPFDHPASVKHLSTELVSSVTNAEQTASVLVLYVGGTIGMTLDAHTGWIPCKGLLTRLLEGNSKFHEPGEPPGTMKVSQWGKKVSWTLKEREILLDSSDMDHLDWKWIAEEIAAEYDKYDGFVLIQGTDTLTYTASALSFMLRYLRKTVVITGSQVNHKDGM